ncbi:MAG TPA: hypothetical protein VE783_07340 [Candidatus Limnocylindrales bacterium]|nr:hypothetical protein [Candidatus Limnocylindrales bacterium]
MKAANVPLRSLILLLAFPVFSLFANCQSQPPPQPQTPSQPADAQSERSAPAPIRKIKIVGIYFFGHEKDGIDLSRIRAALPVHAGDEVQIGASPSLRSRVTEAVQKAQGNPPTDVEFVCCADTGGAFLYIGIAGRSYRPLKFNLAPTGTMRLPDSAMALNHDLDAAFAKAIEKGDAGEDDSKGYALNHDPESRNIQLAIREFALKNEPIIYDVLSNSSVVEHRRAAAEFLGYASQSQKQINALVRASRDPDDAVRNNAVRALTVLARSSPKVATMIPATPFIDLLNSGTWTDRNKGSAVLMELTASRNPKLLAELRARALSALIEMARWDTGHAMWSRYMLGRIAAIPEDQLNNLADEDDQVDKLISAARNAK